jgi:hypothetical protein
LWNENKNSITSGLKIEARFNMVKKTDKKPEPEVLRMAEGTISHIAKRLQWP